MVLNPEAVAPRSLHSSLLAPTSHFRGYLSTTGREKRGGKGTGKGIETGGRGERLGAEERGSLRPKETFQLRNPFLDRVRILGP